MPEKSPCTIIEQIPRVAVTCAGLIVNGLTCGLDVVDVYSKSPEPLNTNSLKLAWRHLLKNQAYTLLNVFGLAVGMAGATLIFLLISFHLSTDSYHKNKDRIYRVVSKTSWEGALGNTSGVPLPIGDALRADFPSIEQVAMIHQVYGVVSIWDESKTFEKLFDFKRDDTPHKMAFVEPSLFKILDFHLVAGTLSIGLAEPNNAVITQSMATRLFKQAMPVGKVLTYEHNQNFKVVGVVADYPQNTDFPFDIFLSYRTLRSLPPEMDYMNDWGSISSGNSSLIMMRKGADESSLGNALAAFAKRHHPPKPARGPSFSLQSLKDIRLDGERGNYSDVNFSVQLMLTLAGIAFVLLLTACINFINLSTAIAGSRAREVGVKKVLGGLPSQLFWQFITETAVVTLIAWICALLIVYFSIPLLKTYFNAQLSAHVVLEFQNLSFLFMLLVVMVTFSGLYPGMVLARFQPIKALKNQVSAGRTRGLTFRKALVMVQFTISQILIFGTLVMIGQMEFIHHAKLGFSKDDLYLVSLPVPKTSVARLFQVRLQEVPGARSVSLSSVAPMSNSVNTTNFNFNDRASDEKFGINTFGADSNYLHTYGLKLAAGRNIRSTDSVTEFLVNETLVRRLGIKDPAEIIGKMIKVEGKRAPIVGVLKDFHTTNFKRSFAPICVASQKDDYWLAGIKIAPEQLIETRARIESIWKNVYPAYVFSASFFDHEIAKLHEDEENLSKIINGFALISIIIGSLGLFGLVSYTALQKTKEIGIRKVLGASSLEIIASFLLDFGYLILIAFLVSAPSGYWIMQNWLRNFEFKMTISPFTFVFALLISFVVTLLTVGLNTYRASVANPVTSLKAE